MNSMLLEISAVAYLISAIISFLNVKQKIASSISIIAFSLVGIIVQITAIILKGYKIGFLPFASQFDSMILFGFVTQLCGFILFAQSKYVSVKFISDLFSIIVISTSIIFAREPKTTLLNPMLNSQYFASHILLAFLGYGIYMSGLAWSIASIFDKRVKENLIIPLKLAYAGLILLGAGILIGAIWADNSWGTYWSWDPKESWALVTWVLLMLYVHIYPQVKRIWLTRLFYCVAIAAMLFTFIGIRLIGIGMHSY